MLLEKVTNISNTTLAQTGEIFSYDGNGSNLILELKNETNKRFHLTLTDTEIEEMYNKIQQQKLKNQE